ncbi:hypothetical protein FKW77_003920 [Venturia effusa]|uniref:BTB domain-containing protein n=1 Tax=Venturia effusa TaxID=50376 RepID=A0A517L344_9PEZI|nr:hypothetical protein FKW77_003920 [Venturia effusa]
MAGHANAIAAELREIHKAGLLRMLETGVHSDLQIDCMDSTAFHVHKAIVCAHSSFFEKACHCDSFQEGNESRINLTVGESGIIKLLFTFLYTFEYDDTKLTNLYDGSRLTTNVMVYAAADFYDVPPLKRLAITNFNAASDLRNWNEGDFLEALVKIYSTTHKNDRGLRDPAIKLAIFHQMQLLDLHTVHAPVFLDILSRDAEIGKDIALLTMATADKFTRMVKNRRMQCSKNGCKQNWDDASLVMTSGWNDSLRCYRVLECRQCGVGEVW